jgi:hypothetical protein
MSENVHTPSWAELPLEILDKIFSFIPRLMVGSVEFVCRQWQCALHNQAVQHLNSCIKQQLIEEKQLQKWGWNAAAATAPDHNILDCNCVDLAFSFFTQKKKLKAACNIPCIREVICSGSYCVFCCVVGEKIFLGFIDSRDKMFSLKVVNRLTRETEPRVVLMPGHYQNGINCADGATHKDMFVVVLSGRPRIPRVQVSLWNGNDEVCLEDLGISSRLQENYGNDANVALGENLLAVSYCSAQETLLWRLNTSQPTNPSPQFMGTVRHVNFWFMLDVMMNESFFGFHYTSLSSEELLVINQVNLFSDDRNSVAEQAQMARPGVAGNGWYRMEGVALGQWNIGQMEPGKSVRLAVETTEISKFKIFNMLTGGVLCDIDLRQGIFPACWCGGNFLFLGNSVLPGLPNKEGILQVVTIDPTHSRFIPELKIPVDEEVNKKDAEVSKEDNLVVSCEVNVEDCEKDIVEDDKEDIVVEYGPTVRYSGTDLQDFSRCFGNFIQVLY